MLVIILNHERGVDPAAQAVSGGGEQTVAVTFQLARSSLCGEAGRQTQLAVLLAALTLACSTKKPGESVGTPIAVQFSTQGEAKTLRFEGSAFFFCDGRGSHRVNLSSRIAESDGSPCPAPQEPDTACANTNADISVRGPLSEPNDIVDIGASSFPVKGRVHDCAAAGNYVAIGTGSAVILIDRSSNSMREVATHPGDRVAVTQGWVAWADDSTVHLVPIR